MGGLLRYSSPICSRKQIEPAVVPTITPCRRQSVISQPKSVTDSRWRARSAGEHLAGASSSHCLVQRALRTTQHCMRLRTSGHDATLSNNRCIQRGCVAWVDPLPRGIMTLTKTLDYDVDPVANDTFAWPSMQVSRRPPVTSTEPRASPFSNMSTSPVAAPTKARSSLSPVSHISRIVAATPKHCSYATDFPDRNLQAPVQQSTILVADLASRHHHPMRRSSSSLVDTFWHSMSARPAGRPRTLSKPGVAGEVLRAVLGVGHRDGLQGAVSRAEAPAQAVTSLGYNASAQ